MIYVVYASQSKMIKDGLKKLLDKEIPEQDPMNTIYMDMGNRRLYELYDEASYLPLGYDKKAVVAENFYYLAKTKTKAKIAKDDDVEGITSYFENPMDEITVFILVYSDTLDDKSDMYKALAKGGAKFIPVLPFTDEKWDSYIPKYFENRGVVIYNDAISVLKERINGDYSTFINEATKLMTYCVDEPITLEIVEKLVPVPLEDDVYSLSNALCHGEIGKAISIYRDLKIKSTDPITLIRLLATQFRFLNQISYLKDRGYSIDDMMRELNCKYGRVKMSLTNLRYIDSYQIADILEDLYKCELDIFTGKIDQDIAFQMLLANFKV